MRSMNVTARYAVAAVLFFALTLRAPTSNGEATAGQIMSIVGNSRQIQLGVRFVF
jgi:hypothetical protein